ncbi:hypothetical protein GW793_03030 [bacterium]|uniref:AMP-dependent synthetase/ligase domain-containing protein n=2 Tax=Katanobacteria TaxID=422282 RepID=A0A2M7X2U6_UNCKA|nr:hypothetical protein [bacterium]PIP56454.1 MAG: hypothetical protein COX05_03020 [candidate division WWE3 bacterium CG22_combo_CG10-13_8_21_14_all_39_12]PJA40467.1 MAG: hypothetical protein CO179_02200 [candidate division WWE3 bacterium CG_4_9_14_3_um_filter_39_7]
MSTFLDTFSDLETKNFVVFYLACKYRFTFFSPQQINKYQQQKARSIIAYATNHSQFFKTHYKDVDITDIYSLPTTNKKLMMDNLGDYNTVGLSKDEILDFCLEVEKTRDFTRRLHGMNIGMSSGTSGNKGVEIVTRTEESYLKAALFARFNFPKHERINLAFILRVSTPAFNFNFLGNKLTYVSQLQSIGEITRQLTAINPNVISAPASMLKIIAREIEAGRLFIKPKKVVSYAEVLHPDVEKYLIKVFGTSIDQIYKCTEGPIAISCSHGSLHINEDLVLVETLQSDGTQTPVGTPCEKLLVTDLHKKSQPIIRYELNDIITISPHKCSCGSAFRVIERIQGRADDVFWAKRIDSGEWQYIFPDYISRAVITASDDIDEFQVVQNSPDNVLLRVQLKPKVPSDTFDTTTIIDNLSTVFSSYGCKAPEISIVFEKPRFNENSNKLIRIQRNFDIE